MYSRMAAEPGDVFSTAPVGATNMDDITNWIVDLRDERKREVALTELARSRDGFPQLPVWIWHSYGTVAIIMQEIITAHILFATETLSAVDSNRVCNALALLQSVAAHRETRTLFLKADIVLSLYPFLKLNKYSKPLEYLRLTTLGIIGALVKVDDPEAVRYLLATDIMPLILICMEKSTDLSRTVTVFILHKILNDQYGQACICFSYDRFSKVATQLGNMVQGFNYAPPIRVLKHIIKCYRRMAEDPKGRFTLFQMMPELIKYPEHMKPLIQGDQSTKRTLKELLMLINVPYPRFLDEQ